MSLNFAFHAGVRAGALAAAALLLVAPGIASAKPAATKIATFTGDDIDLAAQGRNYALTVPDGKGGRQLLVGTGKSAPKPAAGVGAGLAGAIHFGTTADGATVLVYPRRTRGGTADLYVWDLATQKERPIAGVNSKAAESEGVMYRGAVAFTRGERLMYRPATGATRTLSKLPGTGLALGASGVLRVRPITDEDGDFWLLERVSLGGALTRIRRQGIGEDSQDLGQAAFTTKGVQVALQAYSGVTLFRYAGGLDVTSGGAGTYYDVFVFSGADSGYALRVDADVPDEQPVNVELRRVTNLAISAPARR